MKNCRNCGASSPAVANERTYVCEYCKTKNVDEDFFKELARTSDLGKSDRHAQLGIMAYVSDQFDVAEKHFEASVLENDRDAQVWIYLALCKSSLLSASNFERNIKAISHSLERASSIDGISDVIASGKIAIFDRLISRTTVIADYFFETAHKTYVAMGKNKDGANAATLDVVRGVQKIAVLSNFHVTDSHEFSGLLVDALGQTLFYEQKGALSSSFDQVKQLLVSEFFNISEENPELVARTLESRGEVGKSIGKYLNTIRPGSVSLLPDEKKPKGFLSKFFS